MNNWCKTCCFAPFFANTKFYQYFCAIFYLGLMNRYVWKYACKGLLAIGLLFGACNSDDFFIPYVSPSTMEGIIDTVTIRVSNMAEADSVITSGVGVGFSGIYDDPYIGRVQAKTFIEFNKQPKETETDKYARFDSVTLVLRPNGNFYGDTTKYAAFTVSRILNQIEKRDNGYLYSTSTVPTGAQLVDTTIKTKVKDIRNNEIEIKLPRSIGEPLFQGILRDEEPYTSENFLKTFPGLLVSPGADSYCIHGLNLSDTACMIRIYYHVYTANRQDKKMEFSANSFNCFYHLDNDKSKIKESYHAKDDPVSSSKTDNMGIIMSGSPMYTRLEFPHLNELLWLGHIVKIRRATLYVSPIRKSYQEAPLPPNLNLLYVDPTSNDWLGTATMPGGNTTTPQNGNLPKNYQNMQIPEFPQYTFDLTSFISNQLGKTGHHKWALSLIIPTDARSNTIQRLVIGNQNFMLQNNNETQSKDCRIKLEVSYMIYND